MAFVSMTALGMASRAWRPLAWHNHFANIFWAWPGVVVLCVLGHGGFSAWRPRAWPQGHGGFRHGIIILQVVSGLGRVW